MYFLITLIRNFLFDKGIIRAVSYNDVAVLCVGNIRVGGTGKTPMTEYLIRNLNGEFPLAVVSLGYKRKVKGFKEVLLSDTASQVGDEPKQMKEKFPMIPVFVNKDRNFAINYIREHLPYIKLIVLDDAYQYRKTKPMFSVLLTEYNRPYFNDRIIPYGRLRESSKGSKRADYIIVTKCPDNINEQDKNRFIQRLNITEKQQVFFSKIKYILPGSLTEEATDGNKHKKLLFVAGIDNPQPAVDFLKSKGYDVQLQKYADHHAFTSADIKQIKYLAKDGLGIITTEKDAVRLKDKDISFEVLKIGNEIDNNFINQLKNGLRKNLRG